MSLNCRPDSFRYLTKTCTDYSETCKMYVLFLHNLHILYTNECNVRVASLQGAQKMPLGWGASSLFLIGLEGTRLVTQKNEQG